MNNLLRRLTGRAPLVDIELVGLPPFRMETHGRLDPFISTAIEDWGNWEGSGTAIVMQLLSGVADFVDIGANIGWYSLVAAHALSGRGHVHSFEPDPAHTAKLRANIALNRLRNVTVNEVALSDRAGNQTLHLNTHNRGDNSLLPLSARTGAVDVKVMRLDDYPELPGDRPLVIKLDVQGSEIDVLAGAHRLLTSYPYEVVIVCEISPGALAAGGRSPAELAACLEQLGFAAALIDHHRPRIIPMSWERLVATTIAENRRRGGGDSDLVAYRGLDGLMAPIFGIRR